MDELWIGLEPDLIAGLESMALAKDGDDFLLTELGDHLKLGASRLDHLHLRFGAVLRNGKMFGTHAIDRRAAIAVSRRAGERQPHAARTFEVKPAVGANGSFD